MDTPSIPVSEETMKHKCRRVSTRDPCLTKSFTYSVCVLRCCLDRARDNFVRGWADLAPGDDVTGEHHPAPSLWLGNSVPGGDVTFSPGNSPNFPRLSHTFPSLGNPNRRANCLRVYCGAAGGRNNEPASIRSAKIQHPTSRRPR